LGICEKLRELEEQTPRCVYGVDIPFDYLPDSLERFEVDLDPAYQRDHVWTVEQQEAFAGAFLENSRALPSLILNFVNGQDRRPTEVVDGKQRITALLAFRNGEIIAKCPCGMNFCIDEIRQNEAAMREVGMFSMHWDFVALPQKQVMRYYLRLNAGGTIHTKAELDRVRDLIKAQG